MSIAQFLYSNSYVLAALVIFVLAAAIVWRIRLAGRIKIAIVVGLALVLLAGDLLLRVGVSELTSADQFDAALASHQPVFLEIYSNY